MASLEQLAVLVVEGDADMAELLQFFLEKRGATVRVVESGEEARAALAGWLPDVILTEIGLLGEDGFSFVTWLRGEPRTRAVPAIAVTAYADVTSRQRAIGAGFQKFIAKPFDVFALAAAIASVVGGAADISGETPDVRDARLIAGGDLRTLLRALNEPTPYRYTSVLRFEESILSSVWTFDRQHDGADSFAVDLAPEASYCSLVRDARSPFQLADARTDPRVATHVARDALRAYCGVPLLRADGSVFGTLCHYDEEPQPIEQETVVAMLRLAGMLTPALPAVGASALS